MKWRVKIISGKEPEITARRVEEFIAENDLDAEMMDARAFVSFASPFVAVVEYPEYA